MPDYPAAPCLDLVEVLPGRQVVDPYRWLEDAGSDQPPDWSATQEVPVRALLAVGLTVDTVTFVAAPTGLAL